jgi:outer membrane lipoprotein
MPRHPPSCDPGPAPARTWIPWARSVAILAATLALGGCATGVPDAIQDPNVTPVDIAQVQAEPDRHLGRRVRWGGTIIRVRNRERTTEIEILARPLGRDGAPNQGSTGQGRFIAEVSGFVDPAEYPKDRELTVVGIITGAETRPVGDYPYVYPVVRSESRFLWPEQPAPGVYGPPYPWFGPWYDPWYGPFYRPYYGIPRRYWY